MFLIAGCGEPADVPPELRKTALAGKAVAYDEAKLGECKSDSDCWSPFIDCYKTKCYDLSQGTDVWSKCVDSCLDKVMGAEEESPISDCDSIKITLPKKQALASAKSVMTEMDLPVLLNDWKLGDYTYTQKFVFHGGTGLIDNLESDDDVISDFLYFENNDQIASYKLEFLNPAASSKGLDNQLKDFVGKGIDILGRTYRITQALSTAQLGFGKGYGVRLILKGGDSKFYHLVDDGIMDDEPGFLTVILDNGEIHTLEGVKVLIKGETFISESVPGPNDQVLNIDSIEVMMYAEDDYYVGVGKKLSDIIYSAADDNKVLFTNSWDIRFNIYDTSKETGIIEIGNLCPLQ